MNAAIEVIIRTPESADKHEVGALVGVHDPHLDGEHDADAREIIARMLIDWAAEFGDLDVREPRRNS